MDIVKGLFSITNPLLKDHEIGPIITSSLAWYLFFFLNYFIVFIFT